MVAMEFGQHTYAVQIDNMDSIVRVFLEWAGRSATRQLFTPEPLLAVDSATRRGFLLDETYFATLWADRGAEELRVAVEQVLAAAGEPRPRSTPLGLIAAALDHGYSVT